MSSKLQKKVLVAICVILWLQLVLITGLVLVDGESMNNTLQDQSKYLVKDKEVNKIKRFDIVTINSEYLQTKIVKRVVGLPGEEVKYKNNELYVDGELVEQNFDFKPDNNTVEYKLDLEEDEYAVFGDNRANSIDSREIGPIKYDEIENILILKDK